MDQRTGVDPSEPLHTNGPFPYALAQNRPQPGETPVGGSSVGFSKNLRKYIWNSKLSNDPT